MNDLGRLGRYLSLFSQVGVALLAPLLGGILLGAWVDAQLHTTPLMVLVGLALGMASGWIVVFRLLSRFLSNND